MNPWLDALLPYPFERLDALKRGVAPATSAPHLPLQIGEPKHAPPAFVLRALEDPDTLRAGLGAYPPTRGGAPLREAAADWLRRRFGAQVDPETQVLPVNGTREALFSFGQAILSGATSSLVLLPNPCYQTYEGAALLRGATPWYVPCRGAAQLPDLEAVEDAVWLAAELVYICSPGNPTGAVLPEDALRQLIERAHRFDFVIAADECYSEIYADEDAPPPGLLQAAAAMGHTDLTRCVVFHSLSKRSNLPGLRSGFVAGDAAILERYYLYRTYHGCAMPAHVQAASVLAWGDETHVRANRAAYREKFDATLPILADVLPAARPEAAFYLWPEVPSGDERFARALFAQQNVTVMPGTYLGRGAGGANPGAGRVRMALVGETADCVDAAERIRGFVEGL
ncbi:MAG: succinyldiaminopimelate transaminase [Gammaproteobacteria bacterium]|nr:succinyldiaminopimelate transaminase [Gammaproteobacteria bacterium]